jgi:hypothetical protein
MSYHIVAGALERKQMLIKYSNVYQTKDIKPDASVLINMVYTLSFMVVMPRKQIRQRNSKTDNQKLGF